MHRLRGIDAQTIYHETYTSNFVTLKTLIYEQVDTASPVSVRELKASIIEGVRAVGDRGMAMRVIRRKIIHSHSASEPSGEVALPAVIETIPGKPWLAATSLLELFRTYLFEFPRFYRHLQQAREASKDLKDSDSPAVGPFESPFTFLSQSGGPYRIYRYETFPLDEIKAIGKQLDATVNTLVMGICAEALRRYFIEFDRLPSLPLTVTMPVGIQDGKDALKLFNSDIQNNNLAIAPVRLPQKAQSGEYPFLWQPGRDRQSQYHRVELCR